MTGNLKIYVSLYCVRIRSLCFLLPFTPSQRVIDAHVSNRVTFQDPESDSDDELVERQFPKKAATPVAYIQSFKVNEIPILVDYKPRYVDLELLKDGDYSQMLHLFPLMDVELDLKQYEAHGLNVRVPLDW